MIDISFLTSPGSIIKVVTLTLIALFVIFTLIIVNQVRSMNRTISLPSSGIVTSISFILFIGTIGLFVLALVIL